MSTGKIYLQVPYAEKDSAKALGAKWDAQAKKWYISSVADRQLFTKWQHDSATNQSITPPEASNKSGVVTQPSIKPFIPYDGEAPPWN